MKIDFTNTRFGGSDYEVVSNPLEGYRVRLEGVAQQGGYEAPESSINLPNDDELLERVLRLAKEKTSDSLSHIVVVGIGGSNLGTQAVYEAMGGYYDNLNTERTPKMEFVETVDSRYLHNLASLLEKTQSPDEILICVVSKSGRTTETAANADILWGELSTKFGDNIKERFVVITDEGSQLASVAQEEGVATLLIPNSVGGRYSVLSAVGLFPLSCAGFDVVALRSGAEQIRRESLLPNNSAQRSAAVLAHYYHQGFRIHDTFLFDPAFGSLGRWYRQLLAESVGKQLNRQGEEVRVGYTPTVSIGSTDLHSVGQLAFGGPQERITTFVRRGALPSSSAVSTKSIFSRGVTSVQGRTSEEVLEALARGAQEAYAEAKLPFIDCVLEGVTEFEIGAFLQWKMFEIMYLGHLLDVNAFDQPAVEAYKRATRAILIRE